MGNLWLLPLALSIQIQEDEILVGISILLLTLVKIGPNEIVLEEDRGIGLQCQEMEIQ
jgi:hypothetical protein